MNSTSGKVSIVIGIIGILVYAVLMFVNSAYASWGEAVIGISLFMAMIFAIDILWLKDLNIITELRNGNQAIANFIGYLAIAFSIIFFACVAGSQAIKTLG